MKALTWHGKRDVRIDRVPDPAIQEPTDVVVRVDTTTICGTDLHILKGDVPTVTPGRILGHEAVGTVVEVGDAVTHVQPGDRVLASCISALALAVGAFAKAEAAGSSATRSTAPRRSTSGSRSPTTRPTRRRAASRTKTC